MSFQTWFAIRCLRDLRLQNYGAVNFAPFFWEQPVNYKQLKQKKSRLQFALFLLNFLQLAKVFKQRKSYT